MTPVAGIIFRFYSLLVDENSESQTHKLIFIGYYKQLKNLAFHKRDAQSHGELYCQAAIAYLCALQSGQRTQQMNSVFNEIALLIVDICRKNIFQKQELKREVQRRLSLSSLKFIGINLQGKKGYDPICNPPHEGYSVLKIQNGNVLSKRSFIGSCKKFPCMSRKMNRTPNSLGAKAG